MITYFFVKAVNGAGKVNVNPGDLLTSNGKGMLDKQRKGREWAPKFIALQSVPAGQTRVTKVQSTVAEWST